MENFKVCEIQELEEVNGGDAILAALIGAVTLLFTAGFNAGAEAARNRINRNN